VLAQRWVEYSADNGDFAIRSLTGARDQLKGPGDFQYALTNHTDRELSREDLARVLDPIASAYGRLAEGMGDLARRPQREEVDKIEMEDVAVTASDWQGFFEGQEEQTSETVGAARKGIIALAAAQALVEPRAQKLLQRDLEDLVESSGRVARTLLANLDEQVLAKLQPASMFPFTEAAQGICNDMTALTALVGLDRIPAAAFAVVGEHRGALVPLLDGLKLRFRTLEGMAASLSLASRIPEPKGGQQSSRTT
jgi:hypothetical protein